VLTFHEFARAKAAFYAQVFQVRYLQISTRPKPGHFNTAESGEQIGFLTWRVQSHFFSEEVHRVARLLCCFHFSRASRTSAMRVVVAFFVAAPGGVPNRLAIVGVSVA
jgi:hypothetical protein